MLDSLHFVQMWPTSRTLSLSSSPFLSLAAPLELDICPCVNWSLVLAISVRVIYRILYSGAVRTLFISAAPSSEGNSVLYGAK